MKYLFLLSSVFFVYQATIFGYEVDKIYPVSKTLDFYNPATHKSFRIVKSKHKDVYLKIVKSERSYYKVLVVDRQGKATYGNKPFFVWKKYFNAGVLKKAVELAIDVPRKVKKLVHPSFQKFCADCVQYAVVKSSHKVAKKAMEPDDNIVVDSQYRSNGVCHYFAKFIDAGVPKDALQQALAFYRKHKAKFSSTHGQRYISIADYSKNSKQKRFFILDMKTGRVEKFKVSHGSGSQNGYKYGDPNHDGYLDRCTSPSGSRTNMTRLGFFVTDRLGNSPNHNDDNWKVVGANNVDHLKLRGLTPGVNDEAFSKHVYMHGAWYNEGAIMGRSYGCPAFRRSEATHVLNTLKNGSLYYATTRGRVCKKEMQKVLRQVPNWQKMCQ